MRLPNISNRKIRIVLVLVLFIASLFAYLLVKPKNKTDNKEENTEGFKNIKSSWEKNCPNLLIKKEGKIYLQNTNKAEIPGVNPIVFNDIGEYDEFMEWLRSQGVRCPVLFLEYENNAQGENGYRLLRNINDNSINMTPILDEIYNRLPNEQKLMDAGYTANNFPGFDPQNQYQGVETPLDKLHRVQQEYTISDNPMDPNWGGPTVTSNSIKRGKYLKNTAIGRKTATQLALETHAK